MVGGGYEVGLLQPKDVARSDSKRKKKEEKEEVKGGKRKEDYRGGGGGGGGGGQGNSYLQRVLLLLQVEGARKAAPWSKGVGEQREREGVDASGGACEENKIETVFCRSRTVSQAGWKGSPTCRFRPTALKSGATAVWCVSACVCVCLSGRQAVSAAGGLVQGRLQFLECPASRKPTTTSECRLKCLRA